jgi:hypothetical protein
MIVPPNGETYTLYADGRQGPISNVHPRANNGLIDIVPKLPHPLIDLFVGFEANNCI